MKINRKEIKNVLGLLVACLILAVSSQADILKVSAGASHIVVDNSSFKSEIDNTVWNAPNGDISVQNGRIIFPKESTGETRLITRKAAAVTGYYETLFEANYTLQLKDLPTNEKFIAAFALRTAESYHEEAGNLEVVFENKGGIKVTVCAYDDDAQQQILVDAKDCGIRTGKTFQISVDASEDMKVKIAVNNKIIYDSASPVDLEGRMGFLQTGSCAAEIHNVDILSYKYERPENANVWEDFENGTMNTNTMTSTMYNSTGYFPAGVLIEPYNGSNVLMFRNVSLGFFGTKHQYSNFEVSFDVPYILYNSITDGEGNVIASAHGNFVLGIGDSSDTFSPYGYQTSAEGVVFNQDNVASLKNKDIRVSIADKGYFDADKNEGYSVKVTVIDTKVTVYMKALDANNYDELISYSVGSDTPLGYVHIWTTGGANFAIDNFKLENRDDDAKLLDIDYKEAKKLEAEDCEYEPDKEVYLNEDTSGGGFKWPLSTAYAAIAGVIIVGSCTVIAAAKKHPRRKKGEVDIHES